MGADTINEFVGADTVDGGAGTDSLTLGLIATAADLNSASDSQLTNVEIVSGAAALFLTIDLSNQSEGFTIIGSNTSDTITGTNAADTISAGGGFDTINGFVGADVVDGGSGEGDTLALTATSADLNAATNGQLVNVENITAAAAASGVTLNLSNQSERFTIGGSGFADIITAGPQGDLIVGFAGADTVDAGAGIDMLYLDATSADLNAAGDEQLVGVEDVFAAGAVSGVTINLSNQSERFSITGSNSADTITGASSTDVINGFAGADTVDGGDGTDVLRLTETSEALNSASDSQLTNVEIVSGTEAFGSITIDLSNQSEGFIINLGIMSGTNTVTGSSGNDTINGGPGAVNTAVYTGAWIDYTILSAFTYTIADNRSGSPNGTDEVAGVENFQFSNGTFSAADILNDGPTAVADIAAATEAGGIDNGSPGVDPAGNVLTNDTDPDSALGDTKTVEGVAAGTPGGPLSSDVGSTVIGTYGALVLDADGSYVYTVDNANGEVEALNVGGQLVDIFTYTMRDAAGVTSTVTLAVEVNGANDAPSEPVDVDATADTVPESAANSTAVGITASSLDIDGPSLTYSLGDDAGGRFAIEASTGVVTVANGALLDYETSASHDITVEASDGTLTRSLTFTIEITDVLGVAIAGTAGPDLIDATHAPPGEPLPTSEDDTINGMGGNDTINALAGNDLISGGLGADTMLGGTGDDTYNVNIAGDIVIENPGEGTDLIKSSVTRALSADVENLTLTGTAAINGTGNVLANVINGNSGANVLSGLGGSDVLAGAGGADTLKGAAGNDRLIGGLGLDTLTGGADADTFVFGRAIAANADTITDFAHGIDTLEITGADYGLSPGALDPGNFVVGSAAVDPHAEFVYNSATRILKWDPDGVGGAAAIKIATFSTAIAVTASDFVVV